MSCLEMTLILNRTGPASDLTSRRLFFFAFVVCPIRLLTDCFALQPRRHWPAVSPPLLSGLISRLIPQHSRLPSPLPRILSHLLSRPLSRPLSLPQLCRPNVEFVPLPKPCVIIASSSGRVPYGLSLSRTFPPTRQTALLLWLPSAEPI